MSQTIVLGSAARCTDGKGGSISQIVVNPKTNVLEYVIVHRGIFGGHDHCVPAGDIRDASVEGVTLTINTGGLKALPELEVKAPSPGPLQRSIPDYCVVLSKNTPVREADGKLLGQFHGVIVGAEHQVERILLQGKGSANILASQLITCSEDGLTVRLVEQAV
jgi:hypothetical protein